MFSPTKIIQSNIFALLLIFTTGTIALAANSYPLDWDWGKETAPQKLVDYSKAPKGKGIYEIGKMEGDKFIPKYIGRGMKTTLRARLSKHYRDSHNKDVKANRDSLYFRTKEFADGKIAAYVEAVSQAAFEYEYNKRTEWSKHWHVED